jgi:hypothetical protein
MGAAAVVHIRVPFRPDAEIHSLAQSPLSSALVRSGAVRLKYQAMKFTLCALLLLTANAMATERTADFDIKAAERFASLALTCVHKEYPNKLSHTLNSDADVAPPRKLTPAFYGCYDWHSWCTDIGCSHGWSGLSQPPHSCRLHAKDCDKA